MKKYVCKKVSNGSVIILKNSDLKGINFNPKNSSKYGISISKMIIIQPSMIRKLLIKSTRRKLDKFIMMIASITDDDTTSDDSLREALNDLSRYRNIVEFKYKKYLDVKYQEQLIAKIDILEGELKKRIIYGDNKKSLNRIYQDMYQNMYKNMIQNMYFHQPQMNIENENRKSR